MSQNIFYKRKWRRAIFFVFWGFCFWTSPVYADDSQISGLVGVKTNFSDGDLPLGKIVEELRPKNIKVIVLGDDALRRWTYGLAPFRNIIKKTYEENSILKIGAVQFLRETQHIQKENPDTIIIPGARVSPFYAWRGEPFKKRLVLCDWNRKFLILGLSQPEDYEGLPMVSNERFSLQGPKELLRLWPLLLFFLGLYFVRQKKVFEFQGLKYFARSNSSRFLGYGVLFISIMFFLNNLSFSASKFTPYALGGHIALPYQEMIDYVKSKGGLIFWQDPAQGETTSLGPVTTWTEPRPDLLFLTHNYTGIYISSFEETVSTGGVWDKLLKDYCLNNRDRPVWIIGDANLFLAGQKGFNFYIDNVFWDDHILDGLKSGRFYVRTKQQDRSIDLEEFYVEDESLLEDNRAHSGQELDALGERIIISIKGRIEGRSQQGAITLELIKDGQIIFKSANLEQDTFFFRLTDQITQPHSFYRLRISSQNGSSILSNPIFVKRR